MSPRFHPFTRLLLFTVAVLCSALLVIGAVLTALATSAHMLHRSSVGEVQAFFENETNQIVVSLLTFPFVLLCLVGCRRLLDRRSFVSLGLRPTRWLPEFGLGILCGALASTFLFGLLLLTGAVAIQGYAPEAFETGTFASCGILVFFAANFFCVGLKEEMVFRGYSLHNLNAWIGWRGAVIVQALIFAVIHPLNELQNGKTPGAMYWDARWAMVNFTLIGIFFAICYRKTGSLWFPVGFHLAWYFFLGCIWSLPVSGIRTFHLLDTVTSSNEVLTGGAFGAEGSIFLTAIAAVLIFLLRLVPDHLQATLDLVLLETPGAAETPASNWEEEEERGPSRFKTSMRPVSDKPKLDPQIFQAPVPTTFALTADSPFAAPALSSEPALQIDVQDGAFTTPVSTADSDLESASTLARDIGPDIAARTGNIESAVAPEGNVQASMPADPASRSQPIVPAASPASAPAPPATPPVAATEGAPPPRPKKAPRW